MFCRVQSPGLDSYLASSAACPWVDSDALFRPARSNNPIASTANDNHQRNYPIPRSAHSLGPFRTLRTRKIGLVVAKIPPGRKSSYPSVLTRGRRYDEAMWFPQSVNRLNQRRGKDIPPVLSSREEPSFLHLYLEAETSAQNEVEDAAGMKALLLSKYRHLEITDVPTPRPGPDEVLVRVAACGICGSDVHGYDGSSGRRIPPLIMGHEAAGVIRIVGKEVKRFKPGDRVTFDSTISCGACFYCTAGTVNLCEKRQVLGVSCGEYRRHVAFAEYVAVPERIVYALPDELPFAQAAMIGAVSIAVHAAKITEIQ